MKLPRGKSREMIHLTLSLWADFDSKSRKQIEQDYPTINFKKIAWDWGYLRIPANPRKGMKAAQTMLNSPLKFREALNKLLEENDVTLFAWDKRSKRVIRSRF